MFAKLNYDAKFDKILEEIAANYGEEIFDLEGIGKQLDISEYGKKFFSNSENVADESVDANANVDDVTVVAYENESVKPLFRLNSLYLLWKELTKLYGEQFAKEALESQILGDFYINDLSGVQKPYCYNFSAYDVMTKGLPFVKKVDSKPPKYLSSFCGQMVHFTAYASNQVLGAVGVADLLIVMSYYVKKELELLPSNPEYVWRQVKQEVQSLIYSMNQPFRGGLQSGFYNISIYDREFLESLKDDYIFPDGSTPDVELVQQLQDLFVDIMNEELARTTPTFPVTTLCLCVDENNNIKDQEFLRHMSEKNMKFAFMNIYAGTTGTLSSCCRLRSNKENQYIGYTNSFGGASTQIGSFGVVTLNLPRAAHDSFGSVEYFLARLEELVNMSIKINNAKRELIKKRIAVHALPLYDYGFMNLQKQYATTGLNGINEAVEILGYDILTKEGQDIVLKILNLVNSINDKYDEEMKYAHNCEQTPSESSAIKAAAKDHFLGINLEYDLYSNQFIPLITQADMLDRIRLQGLFDSHFSGGAIAHLNVEQQIEDVDQLVDLINSTVKMGVVYHAINYMLQKCEQGHMTVGKRDKCPICNSNITDNYTRIVGFLVNTKNAHKVRRKLDIPNRQFYKNI